MNWIFIALLSGNLVTSQHKDEEACLGRKAMFDKEHKVIGKCVDLGQLYISSATNSTLTCTNCAGSGLSYGTNKQ